jgi:spermidine/putrescine transport system substrate-binding protein
MKRRMFVIGAAALVGCRRSRPRLNVYNWSDYIGPNTISNFEQEFGVEVRYGTFESAPELFAKVMTGNSGWDVIFPSAEYLEPMRKMNLLASLRQDWLPNLDSLATEFRRPPWDPELRWSVPYMHGTTGIAYQRNAAVAPKRWSDLWDERLAGKVTMLDESSEVLAACLRMLGYSLNSGDPDQLKRAQAEAVRQKKIVRAYLNAEVRDQLVAGDVVAGQAWAVTAGQAIAAAQDRLAYTLPTEGFARYADTAAILRESGRAELAHKFIDYLLRPTVAAEIVQTTRTATANGAAQRLLPDAIRNDPVLYPPAAELARGEWFTAQSAASQRLRDRLWTEIKSSA